MLSSIICATARDSSRGHNLDDMSDLQCAATLLIARPAVMDDEARGEARASGDVGARLSVVGREQAGALAHALRGARVAAVYSGAGSAAVQTAEVVAAALGVGASMPSGLGNGGGGGEDHQSGQDDSAGRPGEELTAALETIVDIHRGETVLVVSDVDVMEATVRQLAGNVRTDHALGPCEVAEVAVDADGWVVRSWAGHRFEAT